MKKIISFVLLLSLVLTLSACGKTEITMQEIYDAGKTEALLKNHESIYVRDEMNGEFYSEKYLTKDYAYEYISDVDFEWLEFITDDACYYRIDGVYVRSWSITPDGISSDFASYRADRYDSPALNADTVDEVIESVSKKDGRITVASVMSQETAAEMAELGVTSAKFEYVVDAETYEVISVTNDYSLEDGTTVYSVSELTYDAEVPETVKGFLEYDNDTENMRTITVVNHPGTDKEVIQSVQAAKGLLFGLRYDEESEYVFEVYADAACTEVYDTYADTESDQTVYIKWVE